LERIQKSERGLVATTAAATTTAVSAATAAAAISTTTAAATATAAAGRTLFTRTSDVDREGATVEFLAVEGVNGLLGFIGVGHGDETEATGATGHLVHHQVGLDDGAVCGKRVLEVVFGGVEGKISYIQFIAHVMLILSDKPLLSQTVPERRVSNHH
jgi:hypothetical protein